MHQHQHRYEIGQKLLCFEPDSSKAKLIYFAKILKQVPEGPTDIPHYTVHFHGWKCKWDREVGEDLLLENNEFNRMLKRKIDEVAQNVRGRIRRKQRIDMILETAALSGDDINWDKVPGIWKGNKLRRSCHRSVSSESNKDKTLPNSPTLGENIPVLDEFFSSVLGQEESTQLQFEQLQVHKPYMVSLDFPQNLRSILQSHTDASDLGMNVSKMFHYWCSVLQLLQKYVDGFPYTGLNITTLLGCCSSSNETVSDRVSRIMNPLFTQTDQNRLICAEVCSSLRILFDFTLRDYLLLPSEKSRSTNNVQLYQSGMAFGVNFPHGPNDIQSIYRFASPRYELLPNSEAVKNPKLPCLNYPPHFLLRLFTILPTLLDGMQLTLCRRAIIHRHLYMFMHYVDKTSKFWFGKIWLTDMDISPVPLKMEQPSIQTTASESSGDTEPLTLSNNNNNNNKSLRRTTRNAPKSHLCCKCELSESLMRTKTSHVNVSPTITLNTQSLSVSINIPQISKETTLGSPTRSTLTTISGMTIKEVSASTPVTSTSIPTKGTVNSRHNKSVRVTRSKGVRSERRSNSMSDAHSYLLRGNSLNMLRYACINNLSIGKRLFLPHEYHLTTLSSSSSVKVEKEVNSLDIDPPFKRYKNSTSVLRALISCVQPIPEAPHFQLGPDYTYLSIFRTRYHLLARAKGRLAARVSARDFFPNDITTLSKETPRIDRWVPIQTPDDIIKRSVDGSLSNDEAMDRLILLLAPKHSWKLYNDIAPDHKWTPDTLHRLLDLLCVTNGGEGGYYSHLLLDDYNWSSLPDPDEVYLADNFMIFNKSNNDAQSITGQKDTDNNETVDKVDDITEDTIASLSKHSNIWNIQTTAECLFHKEQTTLNTPQAYRSIIRGAARFKNADRALEVAKIAWSSKYGDSCLDIVTYSLLIRSLHGLTTVKTGEENVWDVILNVLEHVKACGEPINISIYTNILYTLAQTTVMLKSSPSSSPSPNYNYVPIGLGILGEVRRLNLKPELGTLANLLLLIYETPVPVNQQSPSITSKDVINEKSEKKSLMNRPTYASYKCSNLLNQFLDDLEVYFNNNAASTITVNRNSTTTTRIADTNCGSSPKRFDAWTIDDYTFFPIAMKCALNEVNIELGERIHQLLTHYEDRTFLFSSSKMKYHYTHDYCKLMFYYEKYEQKPNSHLVQRYYNTYCQYFNVIISSKLLVEYLIKRYTNMLKLFNDVDNNNNTKKNQQKKLPTPNQLQEINALKATVYSYLCRLLDDILSIEIHYYLQKSLDTVEHLTNLLCDYATLNPVDALNTSTKVLHIFQKLDNDFLKSTNTNTKSDSSVSYDSTGARIDRSAVKNYKQLVKMNLGNSVRLAFPIIETFASVYENNSSNDKGIQEDRLIQKTKLIDTLHEWFSYAEKNHLISWEWAPKALSILWKEDEFLQTDFMWNVIQQLAKSSDKFLDCDADERKLLRPILDILEQSISVKSSSDDIEFAQRLKWLKVVRTVVDRTDVQGDETHAPSEQMKILS
uniref:MRG domain-containing protein n=1 Tax=Trichobilharzia regenti TaxID=157069 RepID=A0AA85JPA9_TRIRE|nr:unnamed protein product [Trichobilharzia regenti]